jgi:serine phosphatase RsbU (regulator of sigma subunit)
MDVKANAPIGLWPDLEFEGEEIESIKGYPMVIYTDGLTEAENRQQEQFGEDRLIKILSTNEFECGKAVNQFLLEEVEKFREGAEVNDDLTLLCLRVN